MKGTIKAKQEIERLFQEGRRSSSSLAIVIVLPAEEKLSGRCAFIAGKKLGSAPLRNRCKRVMRASVERIGGPWSGFDVVFIARRRISREKPYIIDKQLKDQLRKLEITT